MSRDTKSTNKNRLEFLFLVVNNRKQILEVIFTIVSLPGYIWENIGLHLYYLYTVSYKMLMKEIKGLNGEITFID
jgi:ferric iron reductase protein FhuF